MSNCAEFQNKIFALNSGGQFYRFSLYSCSEIDGVSNINSFMNINIIATTTDI